MKINYLISNIKSLKKREISLFGKFLNSELHNNNPEFIEFYNHLNKTIQTHSSTDFDKQELFQILHPSSKFSEIKLRQSISKFNKLLENFHVHFYFLKNKSLKETIILNSLRTKNQHKNFSKKLKKLNSTSFHSETHSLVDPLYDNYLLQKEIYEFEHNHKRISRDKMSTIIQTLDHYYLLENLRLACYDWLNLKESENRNFFIQRINFFYHNSVIKNISESKLIIFYFNIFNILYSNRKRNLSEVIQEFWSIENQLTENDRKYIYLILINYCAIYFNQGDTEFGYLALEIYNKGLEDKILLINKWLSPFTYKNIVHINLSLSEFDNAIYFMDQYTKYLSPDIRENSYQFNLATTYFKNKEYNKALEIFAKTKFIDAYDDLSVRRMLVRIYFENNEIKALLSLLDSFEMYLKRKKKLGVHKDLYLNLIKFTRKSLSIKSTQTLKVKSLLKEIQLSPDFPERNWLEQRLLVMLNKH